MEGISLPHDHGQTMEQELEHMPSTENFQTVADVFKQLSDGSRIRIFWLLCHCEECVINLSAMVHMSSPGRLPSPQAAQSRRADREPAGRQGGLLYRIVNPAGPVASQDDRVYGGSDLPL